MIRTIVIYKGAFIEFYNQQEEKVQEKIEFVLDLVRHERKVPKRFFKQLRNTYGIFEIRVITTFKSIRLLCFLDEGNLVVLINSFVKKTQKTPRKETRKAERLKREYFSEKNQ